MNDTDLINKILDGDDYAFEVLMRRHNQLLFRTARSILKSDQDAEDCVQDSYIKAWKALDKFKAESKLSTWLVRIVVNESLMRLRRTKSDFLALGATMEIENDNIDLDEEFIDSHRPESNVIRKEIQKQLEENIDSLPDNFRTVFILRAVEELSVEEVSEMLEIPSATVRTRFFRARNLLKDSLNDLGLTPQHAFSFDGARCDRIVNQVIKAKNKII